MLFTIWKPKFIFLASLVLGWACCIGYMAPAISSPAQKKKALKLSQKAPKTLSLDFVLGKAITGSDSFKIVMSKSLSLQQAEYEAKALTDVYFNLQAGRQSGQEPEGLSGLSYNPSRNFMRRPNGNYYGVQADTYFQTGTKATLGLDHISGSTNNFQSGFHLSVAQSVLKDAFGYQARRQRQAGLLSTKFNQDSLDMDIENWALDIIRLYYRAWQVRSEVQASQDYLASKRRLVNITRVKLRRGTAERSDMLQTEGSLLEAQIRLNSARETLMAIWRDLVNQLNLPDEWLAFDPMQINMSLDSDYALQECDPKKAPKSSSQVKYWEHLKEASRLKQEIAKNAFLPDLQVVLGLSAINQANTSASETLKNSLSFKNTGAFVGLQLDVPLSHFKAKADFSTALADHSMALASLSFFQGQLKTQWQNECAEFQQLKDVVRLREENHKLQEERATLDERRYRLGRIPLLQIIQSGDEAINSYLQLNASQIELKLSAWRMTQASGQLKKSLKELETKHKN